MYLAREMVLDQKVKSYASKPDRPGKGDPRQPKGQGKKGQGKEQKGKDKPDQTPRPKVQATSTCLLVRNMVKPFVPPRDVVVKSRGDELLPICTERVSAYRCNEELERVNVVCLMVAALNYLWLGGHESREYVKPAAATLTLAQQETVEHLLGRARDLGEVDKLCPDFATGRAQLAEAKFDYGGEPIASP